MTFRLHLSGCIVDSLGIPLAILSCISSLLASYIRFWIHQTSHNYISKLLKFFLFLYIYTTYFFCFFFRESQPIRPVIGILNALVHLIFSKIQLSLKRYYCFMGKGGLVTKGDLPKMLQLVGGRAMIAPHSSGTDLICFSLPH